MESQIEKNVEGLPELPVHLKNATMVAEQLSKKTEEAWVEAVNRFNLLLGGICGKKNLTKEQDEMVRDSFAVLCEYLVGTSVAVMTHYINDGKEVEKYILDMTADKFKKIREMKRNPNGIAVQPPHS